MSQLNSLDVGFKSSSYLTESILDPEFGHVNDPNKTALGKTFNFDGGFWNWLELPENKLRLARFGAAMNGINNMSYPNAILEGLIVLRAFVDCHLTWMYRIIELTGYSWENLPEGSLVVDVGGGVGSQSLTIATHQSHLRFVIQDRDAVVGDAVEVHTLNPLTSPCRLRA